MKTTLPDGCAAQFHRNGYCVIEGAFGSETLAMLREESELAVAWQRDAMRENRPGVEMLNQLDHRYFIPRRSVERPRLHELITSADMGSLLAPLLSRDAWLFIDVFVYKHARSLSDFAWHQDHGYVAYYGFANAAPSVTVWTPLEDVTDDNGALHVLPFRSDADRVLVPHALDPRNNDCVARVDEPGVCLPMRAGSLLVMSGLLLHRSGPNTTDHARPAYQWQYSPAPVTDGERPISLATPFLHDGSWVAGNES